MLRLSRCLPNRGGLHPGRERASRSDHLGLTEGDTRFVGDVLAGLHQEGGRDYDDFIPYGPGYKRMEVLVRGRVYEETDFAICTKEEAR